MSRTRPLAALLPVAALLLGACGSRGDSGASGGAASAAGCPKPCVVMKDVAFGPTALTVRVGQKVTWVNQDSVVHDVVSTVPGQGPHSALFGQGGRYSFTPTRPGRIAYVCTVHPNMQATLTVK